MTMSCKRFLAVWAMALAAAGGANAARGADDPNAGASPAPLPAGAIARLGNTFMRHTGAVGAVTVSADGKRVASAGRDGSLCIWDVATGRRLFSAIIPPNPADMVFGPDGNTLACAYRPGGVTVLSLQDARKMRTFTPSQVGRLARFSRDGRFVVTSGNSGVSISTVADGNELGSVEFEGNPAGLVVAPKGDYFVACSLVPAGGYVVKRWDIPSLQLRWETSSQLFAMMSFPQAVSPDGRLLAISAGDGNIVLLDANTGLPRSSFAPASRYVQWMHFLTPDRLAGLTQDGVFIWDANAGKELLRLEGAGGAVSGLAPAPDGSFVATAGPWGRVGLWDARTGAPRFNYRGHVGPISCVAFAAGSAQIVSGSADGTMRRWTLADGNDTVVARLGSNQSQWLAVAPGGKWALSRNNRQQGFLAVWDLEKGKTAKSLDQGRDYVLSAAFSCDGQLLAAGSYQSIRIWHVSSGRLLQQIDAATANVPMIQPASLAFSPDSKLLAAGGNGIRLFELASGLEAAKLDVPAGIRAASLAFSPDGRRILTGAKDCPLYDLCTLAQADTLADPDDDEVEVKPSAVALSPDGRKAATGGDDSSILIWNAPHPAPAPATQPADATQLAQLWDLLASGDAEKAYQGAKGLILEGPAAATFLKATLKPLSPATQPADVDKLLADLDGDNYRIRDDASRKLAVIGDARRFQEAMDKSTSDEVRARLAELLADLASPAIKDPQELRGSRAIRVLETLGDATARDVLAHLAEGGPGRLTRDAAAALARLKSAAGAPDPATRP
jgi:WD40 repeat protein